MQGTYGYIILKLLLLFIVFIIENIFHIMVQNMLNV